MKGPNITSDYCHWLACAFLRIEQLQLTCSAVIPSVIRGGCHVLKAS